MTNDNNVLEYLSSLDKSLPSPVNALGWCVLSFLMVLLTTHLTLIAVEQHNFEAYREDYYRKSERAIFHLMKGLELTQIIHDSGICSPEDLAHLKAVREKYYFIGDLARTENRKIICSSKHGVFQPPQPAPDMYPNPVNHFSYGNPHQEVFMNYNAKPVIGLVHSLAEVSDIFLQEIGQSGPRRSGHGIIIHTKQKVTPNSDQQMPFILRYNGHIVPQELKTILFHHNTISDFIPLPHHIRTSRQCNDFLDFCVTAVTKKLGLYNRGPLSIVLLSIAGVLTGFLISYLIHDYTTGPRAFIRRLRHAIQKDKIVALYQPQINLKTMQVSGLEALARWYDDRYDTYIPPDIFIPVAENEKLIESLTKKLIIRILQETYELLERNASLTISINVPADVLIRQDFLVFLEAQTAQYALSHHQIILEVTERQAGNSQAMSNASASIQKMGFHISLDDFGTGHSNLEWLTMLNAHEIKIDKIFTQSIETRSLSNMILNSIFHMLEYLEVSIVFEGIETRQQLDYICQKVPNALGQGWLFSKPVHAAHLTQQIEKIHHDWSDISASETVIPFTK